MPYALPPFKGKPFLKSYHHTVKFHRLIDYAKKSTSATPSLDENLIIHGDNLKALKALLPTHAGKVKCIYIDPPYNTGNEGWAYNDNVNSPMIQKWLGQVVAKDDLSRHDKWCCMMYPRLTLLRELLRDDGVIFVSIDDNEVHHLRMMMDEIFGEENFVTEIEWQKRYTRSNNTNDFTSVIDHIVVYAKTDIFNPNLLGREEAANARYENPDSDPRGNWKPIPF
jgi:adenine-specific DNA-methyltransferase